MKLLLTKPMLFERVTRLVDVVALAYILVNTEYIWDIAKEIELTPEDIELIKAELDQFFGEEIDGE